ncbi:hypothetical protein RR49_01167 [Microbacterium ginsengisoli]|uniref:Scaffolding protein n=1 Tax=Microbacterium ginsengisoli TaxID=400772 RepID=A0A0F0LXN9_9MICO|nr:hypothetical protein [Microbacterium ginsengisoli]KJL37055.1 hypothetical protein RR49_01167 [Microbacterium ginsengisoli]
MPEPEVTPTPTEQQKPAETPAENPAERVEDLPEWAQKLIKDTRKEAGDHRTAAKAEKDRVAAILAAAGIKPDEPDPVKVAQQATETANAAVRKLAVFEQATAAGADPTKLLDRASFLTSIAGIDPTDGAAIKTAIEAAIAADQTLKATRAVGASTVETPGGPGEQGQITEAQLAQMTPEQIADAHSKGQLNHLL